MRIMLTGNISKPVFVFVLFLFVCVQMGCTHRRSVPFTREKVGTNGYYGRGVARKRTGDKRGACKDWMKCSELGCVQANVLLPLCDRDLIRLIEEYAGSLDAFSDIET